MANRKQKLIGFGSNYFYALGGSEVVHLDENVEANQFPRNFCGDENDDSIIQLCCTTCSSVALTSKGRVYQVGMLHGHQHTTLTRVHLPIKTPVVEIAGGRHFCLARCDNTVLCWGAGHFGQLGLGPQVSYTSQPQVIHHLLPETTGSPVRKLSCGAWHSAALLENGKILCWGSNRRRQCGTREPATIIYPQTVDGSIRYSAVECGKGHVVALQRETGRVYTWGASIGCGHSSRKARISPPQLVEALQRVVIVQVAAGDSHTLALTGGGRVFAWGSCQEGQLGVGGVFNLLPRPKLVSDLDFVAVVAGQQAKDMHNSTVSLNASNSQFNLDASQKSAGTALQQSLDASQRNAPSLEASHRSVPYTPSFAHSSSASEVLASVPKVVQIVAAGSYSLAISSAGHVYVFGYNDGRVLGLPQQRNLPRMEVPPNSSATLSQMKDRTPQAHAFDSRHNVLLPQRVDALNHLNVELVAGGPNHLLIYGDARNPDETTVVGKTLYEVQQARRSGIITSSDDDDISMHSVEPETVTMAADHDLNHSSSVLSKTPNEIMDPESTLSTALARLDAPAPPGVSAKLSLPGTSPIAETKVYQKPSSGLTTSGPAQRGVIPRALSMSKLMRRFNGSGSTGGAVLKDTSSQGSERNGTDSKPKIRRALSAAFGSSKS